VLGPIEAEPFSPQLFVWWISMSLDAGSTLNERYCQAEILLIVAIINLNALSESYDRPIGTFALFCAPTASG
jgi:hypothetical protein